MEQNNSSEVNDHLANKEMSHLYGIRKLITGTQVPVTGPYPESDDPVHALKLYFLKDHFNIILLSTRRYCKWYLAFTLSV
jgi:hypothetical protein